MVVVSTMGDELKNAVEFVKDRFYLVNLRTTPRQTQQAHFFCIDSELVYEPFFADFGPLNMGLLYRYCKIVNTKLQDPQHSKKKIYHYCSNDPPKRVNAVYLACAYSIMCLDKTPEEVLRPFVGTYPPFVPFRDASYGISMYGLSLTDVIKGLHKGKQCNFIDFSDPESFNLEEYEHFEKVENGDFNWTLPKKFVSFSGPQAQRIEIGPNIYTCTPEDYVPHFKRMGVSAVVRTNKKLYDKRRFTEKGIRHFDMYFLDGSTPSEAILRRFIEVAENEPGAVAVHCKAGLGRTGSLIACYIMKHYGFTAPEVIGWMRIMRPGSIIGPQQLWLKEWEQPMWRAGAEFRKRHGTFTPMPGPGCNPNAQPPVPIDDGTAKRGPTSSRSGINSGLKSLSLDAPPSPTKQRFPPSATSSSSTSPTGLRTRSRTNSSLGGAISAYSMSSPLRNRPPADRVARSLNTSPKQSRAATPTRASDTTNIVSISNAAKSAKGSPPLGRNRASKESTIPKIVAPGASQSAANTRRSPTGAGTGRIASSRVALR